MEINPTVETLWRALSNGDGGVPVVIRMRESHELRLTILVIQGTNITAQHRSTRVRCRLVPDAGALRCDSCFKRISEPRNIDGPDNLYSAFNQISTVLSQHERIHRPATTTESALIERKQPIRLGTRVRVVPTADSLSDSRALVVPPSTGVRVVTRSNEDKNDVPLGRETAAGGISLSTPRIRYKLHSGEEIEVTIPGYVCEKLAAECSTNKSHGREIGGVIVGIVRSSTGLALGTDRCRVIVTDILPMESSDSSHSHFKISAEQWSSVADEIEERCRQNNELQIGWYHTHPDQGIFLSVPDLDWHTNFKRPFQFALVIDPRKLESGLFYWSDYEARECAEPILFRLKLDDDKRGPIEPGHGNPPRGRAPLSWFRVGLAALLFLIIAVQVVYLGFTKNGYYAVSPDRALMIAVVAFASLRSWNRGLFHPVHSSDKVLAGRLKGLAGRGFGSLVSITSRIGRFVRQKLMTIMTVGMIGVAVYAVVLWQRQPKAVAPPTQGAAIGPDSRMNSQSAPIKVQIIERQNQVGETISRLQLAASPLQQQAAVEYVIQHGAQTGDRILTSSVQEEVGFFHELFGFKTNSSMDADRIRRFQEALGLSKADGFWGDHTREVFLSQARTCKSERKLMEITDVPREPIRISFE